MKQLKLQKFKMLLYPVLLAIFLLTGCGTLEEQENRSVGNEVNADKGSSVTTEDNKQTVSDGLVLHYISVGQGDATLIESDGHFMLIDAGENDKGKVVSDYLKEHNVTKLDYAIGTHPHSDHIGGMDVVLDRFDTDMLIISEKEHTSKTFEDVLDAVERNKVELVKAVPGTSYTLGKAEFEILAPVGEYKDDLNNWSVAVRITYGSNSFLFTGDAETGAEADISESGYEVKSDVLKAGHHGSNTASSELLLDKVKPAYAIISCGKDNQYGFPHKEVVRRLKDRGIVYYRTDEAGSITASSNGTKITFQFEEGTSTNYTAEAKTSPSPEPTQIPTPRPTKEPTSEPTKEPTKAVADETKKTITVHITKTGSKYHAAGCRYLKKSDIEVKLEEAKSQGLGPCSVCNPPQ